MAGPTSPSNPLRGATMLRLASSLRTFIDIISDVERGRLAPRNSCSAEWGRDHSRGEPSLEICRPPRLQI